MPVTQKANNNRFKFAANISTMFKEVDIYSRFEEASKNGFKVVEAQFLYEYDLKKLLLSKKRSGVEVELINSPAESKVKLYPDEQFGFACNPGIEVEFINSMNHTLQYAIALDCKKIHVLAGLKLKGFEFEDLKNCFINNMQMAADLLGEHNVNIVIEPMCPEVKENYFLNNFDLAVECLQLINRSNVKLLLDVYHFHMLGLRPETDIEKYLDYVGHIQVSQTPQRNEPFFPGGEINYEKVFEVLENKKYNGCIGLEYTPSDSEKSFEWIEKYET